MNKKEFESLKTGQIIQHKYNNEWAFIVHQNFGDRIVAVRTIEVRNPEEWDIAEGSPTAPTAIETFYPKLQESAHKLHEALKDYNWYQMTGMGNWELIVYTTRKKHLKPCETFEGFTVKYRYAGGINTIGPIQ